MAKRKGFMIPMFFILTIALVAIVGSVTFLTTTSVRNMGSIVDNQKVLYITEAGINKAIWYLTTPAEEGGMGIDWRTEGATEEFGGGSYLIKVQDTEEGLLISAIGSYQGRSRLLEILAGEDFTSAFSDYALLSDKDMTLAEGTSVEGGVVAVTEGNSVSGDGVTGDEMTVLEKPSIDTSYYDNQLAVSEGGGENVASGDQSYGDLNLSGAPLYVNGSIILSGNVTGQSDIVASGDIHIEGSAVIDRRTRIISGNNLYIEQGAKIKKDSVLYAEESVNIGSNVVNGDPVIILTPKNLNIASDASLAGKIYGGQLDIGTNTTITGTVIGGDYGDSNTIADSANIIYEKFDQEVPPGIDKKVTFKKWKTR